MRRVPRPSIRASLGRQLDRLSLALTRANLASFTEIWQHPGRLLWLNFLAGLARGFGIAVGLTIVAAAFLSILGRIASLNLPVIGRYIAELVRLVDMHLRTLPR